MQTISSTKRDLPLERHGTGGLGAAFARFRRAALLATVLSGAVGFTTGCSSTDGGANTALIDPFINTQPSMAAKSDRAYQLPRSPGFDDLNGG